LGRIAILRECTSCDLGKYFSHRAERGKTGRMLAVAGVRPH
jgi:copper oxidase (laccase) domain-containing protein